MAHVYQTFDKNGKAHPKWKYSYRDHLGNKVTGTWTTSKRDTQDHADLLESREKEIRDGTRAAPKESDTPRLYTETTEQYCDWGRAQGGRRGFGWDKDHAYERARTLEWWGGKEGINLTWISDIVLDLVEAKLRELAKTRKSATVQRYSEAIAAFCDWCVERQYMEKDPLKSLVKFDTTPKVPHRELAAAEVRSLLEHAPPDRALVYRVALATGYRQCELRALKVLNLDLFGPSLPLGAEFTKTRTDARQPISKELAQELATHAAGRQPHEPLLRIPKKETAAENLGRDFTAAGIKRLVQGVGKATFHSFRVNYITNVIRSGADLKTAMELARHLTPAMTMKVYAKVDHKRARDCAIQAAEMAVAVESAQMAPKQKVVNGDSAPEDEEPQELVGAGVTPLPVSNPGGGNSQRTYKTGTISAQRGSKPAQAGNTQEVTPSRARSHGNQPFVSTPHPGTNFAQMAPKRAKGAGDDPAPQFVAANPALLEIARAWPTLGLDTQSTILNLVRTLGGKHGG